MEEDTDRGKGQGVTIWVRGTPGCARTRGAVVCAIAFVVSMDFVLHHAPRLPALGAGMGRTRVVAIVMALAAFEPVSSANMGFGLCPLLTQDAIKVLTVHGTPDQQARLLRPMIEGRWTGTMCLTEPQSGSDLSGVRTTARGASLPARAAASAATRSGGRKGVSQGQVASQGVVAWPSAAWSPARGPA